MLRWPTSELPIWPPGRPTARSDASMVACGYSRQRRSQCGFAARAMALSDAASRQPTPSRIRSTTGVTRAGGEEAESFIRRKDGDRRNGDEADPTLGCRGAYAIILPVA